MPRCGATFDKNESPPPEGCRGGLFRRDDPPLKANAFFPLPRGDFQKSFSCCCAAPRRDEDPATPPLKGGRGCPAGDVPLGGPETPPQPQGLLPPFKGGFSGENPWKHLNPSWQSIPS